MQTASPRQTHVLRVCADPNNLPFSNERGEGFENKIAELIAEDMGAKVEYTWWAQRRGFFRNTLKAGLCDLVTGVPSGFEMTLTTSPYYRSTYVFVYRKAGGLDVRSFDDPVLRRVALLEGDARETEQRARVRRLAMQDPRELAARGLDGARGEMQVGGEQVAGEIVRVLGQSGRHQDAPQVDQPFLPFVYDIARGVRRGDNAFRDEVEDVLERRRDEIERLLDEYGVPRVGASDSAGAGGSSVAAKASRGGA